MSLSDYTHTLTQAVSELSDKHSYEGLFHQYKDGDPLPSGKSLRRIVELSREILFPGYFGNSTVHRRTINYHIGVNVEELFGLLTEQIQAGLCFGLENTPSDNVIKKIPDRDTAASIAARFISKLPEIRRILATDVEAAYYGDPAATCFGEIICCYPGYSLHMYPVVIQVLAIYERCKYSYLSTRIATLYISLRIALRISELLCLLQHCRIVSPLFIHLG